jgi:DNA (cytosine-5)-methyltransferase 1
VPKQAKRLYQVGSLFAGMGGFCLAFAKEGFNVAWANEEDHFAVDTYRHNFPATTMHHKPIEDLSVIGDDLAPVDVLTAGFPCQPFSVAGAKLGFDDARGRTFLRLFA